MEWHFVPLVWLAAGRDPLTVCCAQSKSHTIFSIMMYCSIVGKACYCRRGHRGVNKKSIKYVERIKGATVHQQCIYVWMCQPVCAFTYMSTFTMVLLHCVWQRITQNANIYIMLLSWSLTMIIRYLLLWDKHSTLSIQSFSLVHFVYIYRHMSWSALGLTMHTEICESIQITILL